MKGKIEKTDDKLNGVKCLVSNCYYHVGNNSCSAAKIEIAPQRASSSDDTDCETFAPQNDMQ